MTPYYQDNLVTLYHGDCLNVMRSLTERFDLVFTSPPYNLGASPWPALGHWKPGDSPGGKSKWRYGADAGGGVQYDAHEDTLPWTEYVEWQHDVWRHMWDVLADAGAVFWNHKTRVIGARLWSPTELIPADLPIRQEIIWARAGGMNFNPTCFVPTHERIFIVAKDLWRLKSKSASGIGDVWRVAQEPANEHPAPFPVQLPSLAIEASAPTLVLDPFAGSGTTLVAAKRAGVRSVGIEKSERYCALIAERLGGPIRMADDSLFGEVS